jgi:RNase P/RNase MRP subunit POP5
MIRDKRRYITIMPSRPIFESERKPFESLLYAALMVELGEAEYFKANPKIMKFMGKDKFMLRVALERYEQSIVAITLIKSIGGKPIGFYTTKASGTIKALQK